MKKTLSIVMSLLLLAAFVVPPAFAVEYPYAVESGDFAYVVKRDGTITIYEYYGEDSILYIPEMLDGKIVSGVGGTSALCEPEESGFVGGTHFFPGVESDNITKVVLPKTAKRIEYGAFSGCSNLKEINLDYVEFVDTVGFSMCGFETITIPPSFSMINFGMLLYCDKLVEIRIPNSVTEIKERAFEGCNKLSTVYYDGTEESWNEIKIDPKGNDTLINANIICKGNETKDPIKDFTDLISGKWYIDSIKYAVSNGLMNGIGNNRFNPDGKMSRAEFVQVLANIAGIDTSQKVVDSGFYDVKSGEWYAPAVKWASENGVVNGTGNGKFSPTSQIDRQQMCVMLARFIEEYLKIDIEFTTDKVTFFDDDNIADWAKNAVYMCQRAGLVTGVSETLFAPNNLADRASVATLMSRFHKKYMF